MGVRGSKSPGRGRHGISPSERTILNARIVGLALCAAGFIAIYLGWTAAARVTCVDCQLPYLLSAGATGIGLIVFGVGVLLMAEIRAARVHLAGRLPGSTDRSPPKQPAAAEAASQPSQDDGTGTDGPPSAGVRSGAQAISE
jgi:hypothetical protein